MKTDAEINAAIAEWCGITPRLDEYWVYSDSRKALCMSGTQHECIDWFVGLPNNSPYRQSDWQIVPHYTTPNYIGDLNACHEMEKTLDYASGQRGDYWAALTQAVAKENGEKPISECRAVYHSIARQRALAFCKTVGIEIE
jgi:hypothetical protein